MEKFRLGVEAMIVPAKHRCNVESKAVDVHVVNPVAEAVDNELDGSSGGENPPCSRTR